MNETRYYRDIRVSLTRNIQNIYRDLRDTRYREKARNRVALERAKCTASYSEIAKRKRRVPFLGPG